jgi:hypothetical protein
MPDSAFSHKCTPILNLSKKGVRGEKPDRGKQMAHRTHGVRTVRQKNASTMVSINASTVVYIKCSG